MKEINVEGVNWYPEAIAQKTEIDFVEGFMKDEGTYANFDPARKEAALRLVWQLSNPVVESQKVADPPKAKASQRGASSSEGTE